jgi:two-component system, response regulator, stage 0 sporulation protein F
MQRPLNILSVDNQSSVGLSLRYALESFNRKVTSALNAAEALAKITEHSEPYDVVIIDNKMPGMSGLDFVRDLRARDFGGKIIVLAAQLTDENRRAYAGLNVDTIFLKPFDLHQLREVVDLPKAAEQPGMLAGSIASAR